MRIVSLLPSATEILFAIGAGDEVVGVTHECDYPRAALDLPHLTASSLPAAGSAAEIDRHVRASLHAGSSLYHLDSEMLARLEPDLIVTQELCDVCAVSYDIVTRAVRKLRGDPRLISLEPSSLEDVFGTMTYLGEITGHSAAAASAVGRLRARCERLRSTTRDRRVRPRTLVLEWTDPPMSGGHWTNELVELAGGTPLLGNPGANSQRLEWETIAASDPDVVIVAPCGFDLARTRQAVDELAGVAAWRNLRAMREGGIHLMDGNAYLNRPGPRLVDTAEIMMSMVEGALRTAR